MGNKKYGGSGFGSTRLNEVNYLIVIHRLDRKGLQIVLLWPSISEECAIELII